MKKYFLFIAILTISIIAIFSCRKSCEPETKPDQVMDASSGTELKIQAFIHRMNSNLKDETTYSIEDAIWYAEATLNYTYAIYDSSFVLLSRKSSTFSIDLNENNTINHNDLLATYSIMVDSLEAHYDEINETPKHVFLCNIVDVSHSVGQLDLLLISVIAYNYTLNQYGTFGQNDYWYSGDLEGRCYPTPGVDEGRDATTELEYKLLHPLIATSSNVRIYYTDIDSIFNVDPVDYPYENAPRGYRGYVYGSNDPNDWVQCLPPSELNFYLSSNGIPYIIEDRNIFIDKEFCDIDIIWYFAASTEYYVEQHFFNIAYGVKHETQIAASEL